MSSVNLSPSEIKVDILSHEMLEDVLKESSPLAYNLYKESHLAYKIFTDLMNMMALGFPKERILAYYENGKHQDPKATALASRALKRVGDEWHRPGAFQEVMENAWRNREVMENAWRREEEEMEGKEDEGEGLVGVQPQMPGEAHHEGQVLAHNAEVLELGEFDREEEEIEGDQGIEEQMPIDLNAPVPREVRALLDGIPVPVVAPQVVAPQVVAPQVVAPQEEVLEAPAQCCIIL